VSLDVTLGGKCWGHQLGLVRAADRTSCMCVRRLSDHQPSQGVEKFPPSSNEGQRATSRARPQRHPSSSATFTPDFPRISIRHYHGRCQAVWNLSPKGEGLTGSLRGTSGQLQIHELQHPSSNASPPKPGFSLLPRPRHPRRPTPSHAHEHHHMDLLRSAPHTQ
jgi:hypothetical protein